VIHSDTEFFGYVCQRLIRLIDKLAKLLPVWPGRCRSSSPCPLWIVRDGNLSVAVPSPVFTRPVVSSWRLSCRPGPHMRTGGLLGVPLPVAVVHYSL